MPQDFAAIAARYGLRPVEPLEARRIAPSIPGSGITPPRRRLLGEIARPRPLSYEEEVGAVAVAPPAAIQRPSYEAEFGTPRVVGPRPAFRDIPVGVEPAPAFAEIATKFGLRPVPSAEPAITTPSAQTARTVSPAGLKALKVREGFRGKASDDAGGLAVGYGMRTWKGQPVTPDLTVSPEEADEELVRQLDEVYRPIVDTALKVPVTQGQYDALLSVAWNRPAVATQIIDKLNRGDTLTLADFQAEATVRGRRNESVLKRRQQEYEQFSGAARQPTEPSILGLVEPGNIDLAAQPRVPQRDGTVSTVRSISINEDGREVLIPTVAADGSRVLSDEEAITQYRRTGKHLGVFENEAAATKYAAQLHRDYEAGRYEPPPRGEPIFPPVPTELPSASLIGGMPLVPAAPPGVYGRTEVPGAPGPVGEPIFPAVDTTLPSAGVRGAWTPEPTPPPSVIPRRARRPAIPLREPAAPAVAPDSFTVPTGRVGGLPPGPGVRWTMPPQEPAIGPVRVDPSRLGYVPEEAARVPPITVGAAEPPREPIPATPISESWVRGADVAQGLVYAALEATGELLALEQFIEIGRTGRERNEAELAAGAPRREAHKIESLGDFTAWAKDMIGEQIPIMGPIIMGGVTGAAVGSVIPGVGTTLGGVLGAFLPALTLGVGTVQRAIKERDPAATAPGLAFLGGSAVAALDTVLPYKIGSSLLRLFGREIAEEVATRMLLKPVAAGVIRRTATGAATSMGVEGVTEAFQEAIEDVTAARATKTPVSPTLPLEMFEAGAAGGLFGFLFGGAAAAPSPTRRRAGVPPTPLPTPPQAVPAARAEPVERRVQEVGPPAQVAERRQPRPGQVPRAEEAARPVAYRAEDLAAEAEARMLGQPERPAPALTPEQVAAAAEAARGRRVEPERHEFSSTQFNLPAEVATPILEMAARIPDAALVEDGRTTEPHLTLLYGLKTENADAIRTVLEGEKPFTVKLGQTSVFTDSETQAGHDVVKVDVKSATLHRLHQKVADALETPGETFPRYQPHVTLAYVRSGAGAKYAGDATVEGQTVTVDRIVFSAQDGSRVEIPLTGKPSAVAAETPAVAAPAADRAGEPPVLTRTGETTGWINAVTTKGRRVLRPDGTIGVVVSPAIDPESADKTQRSVTVTNDYDEDLTIYDARRLEAAAEPARASTVTSLVDAAIRGEQVGEQVLIETDKEWPLAFDSYRATTPAEEQAITQLRAKLRRAGEPPARPARPAEPEGAPVAAPPVLPPTGEPRPSAGAPRVEPPMVEEEGLPTRLEAEPAPTGYEPVANVKDLKPGDPVVWRTMRAGEPISEERGTAIAKKGEAVVIRLAGDQRVSVPVRGVRATSLGPLAHRVYRQVVESARGPEPAIPAAPEAEAEPEADLPDALGLPSHGYTRRPADPLRQDAASPIAPGLSGQLGTPPAPIEPGKPVSAPQVISALADVTEAAGKRIPMRVGRVGRGRMAGIFKVRPEVVRTRSANDIPSATHEVAHAIEKLLWGWPKGSPWKQSQVRSAIQKELVALGRALYGESRPAGGYKREGWAEFIRTWVTESTLEGTPITSARVAPQLHAWFEGSFAMEHPEVRKALETARDLARRWRTQGAQTRARMSVVDPAGPRQRLQRAFEAVRHAVSLEKLVEMAQPLYELAREAETQLGRPLRPSEDPFFSLSTLRMTHAARARYMVETAMIDLAGNRVGPALDDIRALVKGRRDDFLIYLWARRAHALLTDPKGPRAAGLSLEDAQQIIRDLETPKFQLAAEKVYDWNAGVLNYAAQASPTLREVVERVRVRDPGAYIPLQRVFEELDGLWARAGRGVGASRQSPVKRLKGSGRQIKDPFQAMISQAERTLRQAHTRLVLDQIVKLAQVEGLGHLIEEVPVNQRPAAEVTVAEILERLEREVGTEVVSPVDADSLARTLTFFAPAERPAGQDPIVPIYDQGQVRWFQVDGKLYDTLSSLDVYRLPDVLGLPILDVVFGMPARLFRAGTTGLRASFGLLWNPVRDVQTFGVNTQSGKSSGRLFAGWLRSMGEMGLGRTTGLHTEWVDTWLRLGGEMAQPLGQDIPHTRRAARRLFEGPVIRTIDPRNWFDFYRDLVQFPEGAPRVAELRFVADQIGWRPGEPMTLDQSMQLLLASKQVTTDFTAAGELARVANQMIPFVNAAIQGPRANLRAARRNPALFAWRGLQLTALTLLLWWGQKDEEWYTQMPFRERWLHWHFPFEWEGVGQLVRLPRAFEIGIVFSALPEMLMDAWYRQEPEQATEYMKTFIEVTTPDVLPVLPRVAAEQLANREFFWDRPIETMAEERKPPEERFNEYTSRAAIVLGDIFNASPKRIDHAIEGVFGYVGGDVLKALRVGPPGVEREADWADLPIVGRGFQRGGEAGVRARAIDELYDALEVAQQRQASDQYEETSRERQERLQLSDAAQAVSALFYVRRSTPGLADRNQLSQEAIAIATEALAAQKGGELIRGRFAAARRRAQAQRERAEREERARLRQGAGGAR